MKQREGKSKTNTPGKGNGEGRYKSFSYFDKIMFLDNLGTIFGGKSGFGQGRGSGFGDGWGAKGDYYE